MACLLEQLGLPNVFGRSVSPSSRRILHLPSILSLPHFMEAIPIPIPDNPCPEKDVLEYETNGTVTERSASQQSNISIKRLAISDHELNKKDLDFVVMMCPADGLGLAFCRNGDSAWTLLPGSSTCVKDVVYSKKNKLFHSIVTEDGKFQAWDFNNADDKGFPKRIDFDFNIPYGDFHYPDFFYKHVQNNLCSTNYYLVELPDGDILFLARYSVSIGEDGFFVNVDDFPDDVHFPMRTAFFAAFKLDFEERIGLPVKSLGDTPLFVGLNESFSLSTRDHPQLMANSIYFADDKDNCIYNDICPYGGEDIGVYNIENYSVTPLFYPFQFKKIRPPPIWVLRQRP